MILTLIRNRQIQGRSRVVSYDLDMSMLNQQHSRIQVLDTLEYQIGDIVVLQERGYFEHVGIIAGLENNLILIDNFLSMFDFEIPVSSFQTSDGSTMLYNIINSYSSNLNNFYNVINSPPATTRTAIAFAIENYVKGINLQNLIGEFFKQGINIQLSSVYRNINNWTIDLVIADRGFNGINATNYPTPTINKNFPFVSLVETFETTRGADTFNMLMIVPETSVTMGTPNTGEIWYRDTSDNVTQTLTNVSLPLRSRVFVKRSDDTTPNQHIAQSEIPSQIFNHEVIIDLDYRDSQLDEIIGVDNLKIGNRFNLKLGSKIYSTVLTNIHWQSERLGIGRCTFGFITSNLRSLL